MANGNTYDLTDVRVEQATLLKERVLPSCVYVTFLIGNYTIILGVSGFGYGVAVWFATALAMVFVTYFYAKLKASTGITRDNVDSYLKGHVLVSSMTGVVWGGYAAYIVEPGSVLSILISTFLVCGITIGGMLPSSAYRPGYLGLATFALTLPALCISIEALWPLNLIGLAIVVYFTFGIITSKRGEQDLHESIFARHERERTAQIEAENTIIRRVNEEKSRFLAATSHDLSQPLHAQGYFIQALKQKLTRQDQIQTLDKIEQTWRRQGDFLRGLIDMNRLDSGAIIPKPEQVDIETDVAALVDEFQAVATASDIILKVSVAPAKVYTDPVLFNRVLRNLVSNAIRYTQAGGIVEIVGEEREGFVALKVRDNGPGIHQEQQGQIFNEYVQLNVEPKGQKDGLGLGLSIVKRLVALLNYELKLESSVGEGTCFTLAIPASELDDMDVASVETSTQQEAKFASAPLIVLVEDDDAIRESMAGLLTDWGCQLICASSGHEAVSLLSITQETPALIIVDRCLGNNEDGSKLIELLREEVNEETLAILMSGEPQEPSPEELGAQTVFLRKPVEPSIILSHIQRAQTEESDGGQSQMIPST